MEMVRVSSGFCVSTPNGRDLLPSLAHQVLPHPLCLLPADVLTGLQRGRGYRHEVPLRTLRQRKGVYDQLTALV